jgi:hypothetical protein
MCGLPLTPALILTGQTVQSPAAPPKLDLGNLRAFVELARSDLRTQKALVVAQNMDFNEAEAVEFWPLHREYDGEGNKLLDQRYELIVRFARNYQSMTDAEAAELATKAFALESKRTDLKRKYFKKFRNVVPARKAARFFQIEHQLNMALDLQLAASLPLIK